MTSDTTHSSPNGTPDPPTSEPPVGMPTEPARELRLDDQLCFALYTAASAVVRNYRPLLAALGLTYPQYILLMTLWEHDHRPTNASTDDSTKDSGADSHAVEGDRSRLTITTTDLHVGQIAARLRVPVNNIAPILDRLEEVGLVERRRSRHDRRHINVVLTQAGRTLEQRAAQAQHRVRCQTKLSPRALDALRGELHALTHTLDDNL